MPKVRNITVAVSPELYRQTRRIAADSDTTVSELVRHILVHLPELLRSTNHPAADSSAEVTPPSPAVPASFAIPPSRRAAPAPQQEPQPAAYRSRYATSSAIGSASLARSRAAALRQVQRLLNS